MTGADSARAFRLKPLERTRGIEEEFNGSDLNLVGDTGSEAGMIMSGAWYNYTVEAHRTLAVALRF